MLEDFRYSLRHLRRQPAFALIAIISLAAAIGVNTAIFSVLDTLLWRAPALRHLDRTVVVYDRAPGTEDQGLTFPAFQRYHERRDLFARSMAISAARPLVLTDGPRRDQVYAELVTSDFFAMADVALSRGAAFSAEADRAAGLALVTVLSHDFWARRFDADPSIVGTFITLNGQPFLVSGVANAGFRGLDVEAAADMWIPIATWARLVNESSRLTSEEHWLTMVAELAPGVRPEQTQAALQIVGQAVGPSDRPQTMVRAARDGLSATPTDAMAMAAGAFGIGMVLLALACSNVTNLLIARGVARQHEMAVRLALGSSRARLLRLWIADGLLLSLSAAVLGLVVGSWLLSASMAFKPPVLIGQAESPSLGVAFNLDFRMVVFTLVVAVLTAVAVGLLSGLSSSRAAIMTTMRMRGGSDRRSARGFSVNGWVIALQMALSTILLVPGGLLARSAVAAASADPGFDAAHVLLLPISGDQAGIRIQRPDGFERDLVARVSRLPGVVAASVMDPVPLWFGGNFTTYDVEGYGRQRVGESSVGPGYFAALRVPLLAGRDFGSADTASAPAVAIVGETFARRFWTTRSALGQRLRQGRDEVEIVGVVRDTKHMSLAEGAQLWLYRPITQSPSTNTTLSLAVRTTGDPDAVRAAVEREVLALVPNWPSFRFRLLEEGLRVQQTLPGLAATLLGTLGLFGMFLASLGIYGVTAYVVRQRRRELGIRLALGAETAALLRLVVRQEMTVCATGAVAGVAIGVVVARMIASVLYGVGGLDVLTCVVVPCGLLLVAFVACYLPARRVTQINAWTVLRSE